ncbi:MAG: ribulose-phosphate 3-epimerase [Bacilli bacterium]|nr:ribulose-phosphate 3-epimerase [Bacilli bacterium]
MILSPSILAADRNNLSGEANKMAQVGASYIHIDIMDGVFVPAYTWDANVVKELKEGTKGLILDTHLMIAEPMNRVDSYIEAGSDIITVHLEAFESEEEAKSCLAHIRERGRKAGISIKPNTPVTSLLPYLPYVDLILIMSVEPGKGGQKFMPNALGKIAFLAKKKREGNFLYLIEVDGGINFETGRECKEAGVEILVAGSYLYGKEDYRERAEGLLAL